MLNQNARRKGLRTRVRKFLFAMTVFMYIISSVDWALSVVNVIQDIQFWFLSITPEYNPPNFIPVFNAICLINVKSFFACSYGCDWIYDSIFWLMVWSSGELGYYAVTKVEGRWVFRLFFWFVCHVRVQYFLFVHHLTLHYSKHHSNDCNKANTHLASRKPSWDQSLCDFNSRYRCNPGYKPRSFSPDQHICNFHCCFEGLVLCVLLS